MGIALVILTQNFGYYSKFENLLNVINLIYFLDLYYLHIR